MVISLNTRHANFRGRNLYFAKTGVRKGSAIVLLCRRSVSFYKLLIVAIPLTESVWP